MSPVLQNRIAVVTGASRGIGRAVARRLGAAGAHVVALARTVGGLEELDDEVRAAGGSTSLVPVDLSDGDALDRLGQTLHERYGRIDILVGNAGILGPVSPLSHVRPKEWEKALAVNLTANWRLIRSFDPLLRASDAGRAVFVTSGASWKDTAYWGVYSVTKAGLNALVRTYASETLTTPIRVNLFSPGPVRTDMRASAMPGEDPMTLPTPDDIAEALFPLVLSEVAVTGKVYEFREKCFLDFHPPTAE